MISSELIFGVAFFLQCVIGIVGNSLLLVLYVCIAFKKPQEKKPMDLILVHLTVANMATLFTRGIPEIMFCFGMRNLLNDLGCKVVMYIYRISRGFSVCTTSLLSMFQAIIISPNNSVWARIKVKAPKYILHCFLFFCVTNALIYIRVIEHSEAIKNDNISRYEYISHIFMVRSLNENESTAAFLFGMTLHDFIYHLLMALSSTHMVLLLYRHSKQVQHIYSNSHSYRSFPEIKATQTILLLVSCFVLFYWINNCCTLYVAYSVENKVEVETIGAFFGGCYPALSPLLLIGSDNRIGKLHFIPGKEKRLHKDFMNTLVNY
ncbi:vomeronasal 1 receptor monDomV1R1284 [Monodelphis domestica]|uniref:Vomeronasal type-1 receptor n=1 Tax=Monodelphis domestica TaxID=13616 RepID=A0A5F8GIG9_MONDO|nr:vomeronasal 1 receptor monDomV1R1284 [Monodelphis domestica]